MCIRDRGRIIAVGEGLEIPEGMEVIDIDGFHLVPGLIDGSVLHDREHDALYISHGVTLVRDMGSSMETITERREAERERVPGPALLVAGQLLDGLNSRSTRAMRFGAADQVSPRLTGLAASLTELARRDQLEPDAYALDYLSVSGRVPADIWGEILRVGHELGLSVWSALPASVPLSAAVELGLDGLTDLASLLPPETSWREATQNALDESIGTLAGGATAILPRAYNIVRQARPIRGLDAQLRQLSPFYEEGGQIG